MWWLKEQMCAPQHTSKPGEILISNLHPQPSLRSKRQGLPTAKIKKKTLQCWMCLSRTAVVWFANYWEWVFQALNSEQCSIFSFHNRLEQLLSRFFGSLSRVPWLPSSGEFWSNSCFCLSIHGSPGIRFMQSMLTEKIRKLKGDVCNHTSPRWGILLKFGMLISQPIWRCWGK